MSTMPERRQAPYPKRLPRPERARRAGEVAVLHAGVAHRRDLRKVGVSRSDVRGEVHAGRWRSFGRQTVLVGNGPLHGEARYWHALWESGSGAVLDGAAALVVSGLTGFTPDLLDVSVPAGNRSHPVPGVRLHLRRPMPALVHSGVPRVRVDRATVHAAAWASSDRGAALLLCLVLQQRLTTPARLASSWLEVRRYVVGRRRAFVDAVLADLTDGARSLGELDFVGLCRDRRLPEPERQVVRTTPEGRIYLDARWRDVPLVVEVDGGHHALALSPVDDAWRQNEIVLGEDHVLRLPVLGLRLDPDRFMDQVVRALERWGKRAG